MQAWKHTFLLAQLTLRKARVADIDQSANANPVELSGAGYLQGQQPTENPYLAAQRRAKEEAGLSQQQRRLQQWTRANAGECFDKQSLLQ